MTARGKIVKDSSGTLILQVRPNQAFDMVANELSQTLGPLAGTDAVVTIRGRLYQKPPGKKRTEPSLPLKLTILEVQKLE